jgi:hypothetical protein
MSIKPFPLCFIHICVKENVFEFRFVFLCIYLELKAVGETEIFFFYTAQITICKKVDIQREQMKERIKKTTYEFDILRPQNT